MLYNTNGVYTSCCTIVYIRVLWYFIYPADIFIPTPSLIMIITIIKMIIIIIIRDIIIQHSTMIFFFYFFFFCWFYFSQNRKSFIFSFLSYQNANEKKKTAKSLKEIRCKELIFLYYHIYISVLCHSSVQMSWLRL
jgi:hypothetical protein